MGNKSFLSITPLKLSEVPSEEIIISEATRHIESTSSWKIGKTFHGCVATSGHPKTTSGGGPWHCRISRHKPDEVTFDVLWDKMANNKAENEKGFIPDLTKVTKVKELSPTAQVWTLYYSFKGPLSPRVFTVLQVSSLSETKPRTGIIVSIPIDLSDDPALLALEEKGAVRGRYVAVERVLELEDGDTEWRMAVSTGSSGNIPGFLGDIVMKKEISKDVPLFLKWYNDSK